MGELGTVVRRQIEERDSVGEVSGAENEVISDTVSAERIPTVGTIFRSIRVEVIPYAGTESERDRPVVIDPSQMSTFNPPA